MKEKTPAEEEVLEAAIDFKPIMWRKPDPGNLDRWRKRMRLSYAIDELLKEMGR